ncbi:hypothetical protein FNF28_07030 [Cafeteria roenbergensis]|uniref:Carboxylesterase type B domain-containing protein n=1 Tax=Cafeteria roenbergensis TaxID=33653 RepID=A0A5A8CIN5_CAFRO|nr:hypothetical protein FNF28_07030 [Cafeteria roenbergensis]
MRRRVGNLRLRNPQPPKPWAGTLDANGIPQSCPQLKLDGDLMLGGEDCLYLRVWRPANMAPGQQLPVMVWLYGGGFVLGSADEFGLYDGTNLATKHNVIIVAPNYRLNSLGFLALPELAAETGNNATGNMGLLDQQIGAALDAREHCQFRRRQLEASPFSASPPAASRRSTEDMLKSILDWLDPNWPFTNRTKGLEGRLPASSLRGNAPQGMHHISDVLAAANPDGRGPPESLRPAVAARVRARDAWAATVDGVNLPVLPLAAIRSGNWAKVPFLAGSNKNEASILAPLLPIVVKGASFDYDDETVRLTIAQLIKDATPAAIEAVTNATLLQYPSADYKNNFWRMAQLFTHYFFSCDVRRAMRSVASQQSSAWLYSFERKLSFLFGLEDDLLGDYHSSEIAFVFGNQWPPIVHDFDADDAKLSEAMGTYWTNMARWHQPSHADDGQPTWSPYTSADDLTMTLASPVSMRTGYVEEACDFWDRMECIIDPQGAACSTADFQH